jgi:hypothetical protein
VTPVGAAVSATVAVFGGDPVVGRALEALLQTVGYSTKFVAEGSVGQMEVLEGVRVLLLAPRCSPRSREAVLAKLRGAQNASRTSVLEIGISANSGAQVNQERFVPWPCRTEDLKRRIEIVLLSAPVG